MDIAILSLQGAFVEHAQMLNRLGANTFEVHSLADWNRHKDGLILPGGESTVMMKLMDITGLKEPIQQATASGLPVFGTCAGMILLSEGYLSTMDIQVKRNAYGRQLGSFHTTASMAEVGDNVPMTFIRAPFISEIKSKQCHALSIVDGNIVAARQDWQLTTAFHPELDKDYRIHKMFLSWCEHH